MGGRSLDLRVENFKGTGVAACGLLDRRDISLYNALFKRECLTATIYVCRKNSRHHPFDFGPAGPRMSGTTYVT